MNHHPPSDDKDKTRDYLKKIEYLFTIVPMRGIYAPKTAEEKDSRKNDPTGRNESTPFYVAARTDSLSIVALAISAITLLALVCTLAVASLQLDQMIVSTKAADKSAAAAKDNAVQAAKSFNATIDQFRLDQRAWVGIDAWGGIPKIGEPFIISVQIKNSGKTPALNVQLFSQEEPIKRGEKPTFSYAERNSKTKGILPPNATMTINLNTTKGVSMNKETMEQLGKEDYVIYVYGKIIYDDVFGESHWIKFCSYLRADFKGYDIYSEYNEIDPMKKK
jgi:hypothetical protein